MKMEDGGYLNAYRRFFIDFFERMNPNDQLPVKMAGHDVTEEETVGEIIDMTLQYLNQKYCPPSLQSYLVRIVIEEMQTLRGQQPESCGLKPRENVYAPLKFMQAVTGRINEICQRYLENSRLALLPPPPSVPLPIVTVCAIKNSRRKMEDRHVVMHDLNAIFNMKDECAHYYAVFDGHAGQDAAIYSAAHLHRFLHDSVHYPTDMERALRDAFVTTDAYFIQKSLKHNLTSGTTAVCIIIFKQKLYVAWAGDSQAALVKRGNANQLVNPHRPDRNDERDRIEKMGGTVLHYGMWRVNGHLAVSRAIGDAQYKPYVTADPEIRCVILDGTEDFVIIACDGLWDFVDEKTAAAVVYQQLYRDPHNYDAVSQHLVSFSKTQGSADNITAIVVFLTPPSHIAARSIHTHPLLADVHLDNMDEGNSYLLNLNEEFKMQTNLGKQALNHTNGTSCDGEASASISENSRNGKHENGSILYDAEDDDDNDDDDDDDDDDDEDDDDNDLGPETDVDAIDHADEMNTLSNVSRELFPDHISTNDSPRYNIGDNNISESSNVTKSHHNELIVESENVVDSEDSDDEWNYYKVDPNKRKDCDNSESELKVQSGSVDEKSSNQEIYKTELKELSVDEKKQLQQFEEQEIDFCSDNHAGSEQGFLPKESLESSVSKIEITAPEHTVAADNNSEDMEFQLNPDAAEFVPVSPIISARLMDRPLAGSPLKKTPIMDDISLPSPKEFSEEADHRPHEVDGKEDMIKTTNGDFLMEQDSVEVIDKQKLVFNLDESEISSTRAEFGDESTTSFLTIADYPKIEGMDGSFTDSCPGVCSHESTTNSYSSAAFNPLGNPVDLNAVHDLSDTDLCDQDDQTAPKESQMNEWGTTLDDFIGREKHEIPSPDVHPELVDLISPESDQPPHSVAFPDDQGNDLFGGASSISKVDPLININLEESETLRSKDEGENSPDKQSQDVDVKEELTSSKFSKHCDETDASDNSIHQVSHSNNSFSLSSQSTSSKEVDSDSLHELQSEPPLEIYPTGTAKTLSSSSEACPDLYPAPDLMLDNVSVLTMSKSDMKNVEGVPLSKDNALMTHNDIFENPLNNQFDVKPVEDLPYTSDDGDFDEDTKMAFMEDEGPISQSFDAPTGDPFSRSLSPMPGDREEHDKADVHTSPFNSPPQFSKNGEMKLSESLQEFTGLENQLTPQISDMAIQEDIKSPEIPATEQPICEIFESSQENTSPSVEQPLIIGGEEISIVPIDIEVDVDEEGPVDNAHNAILASMDIASKDTFREGDIAVDESVPIKSSEVDIISTLEKTVAGAAENKTIDTSDKIAIPILDETVMTASNTTETVVAATDVISNLVVSAKAKSAGKSPIKTVTKAGTSKPTNRSSPTSPTKTLSTTSSRSAMSPLTKKAPITVAPRPKPAEVVTKTSPQMTKLPAMKSTTKPSPRMTVASKSKPMMKSTSSTIEKKHTGMVTNGETKHAAAKQPLKSKTTVSSDVSPKSLVKSTTSARSTTVSATKLKPTVGSTNSGTKTTSTVPSATAVASRPKTAPATLAMSKTKVQRPAKSPGLDKQIKESANKHISSSRTSTAMSNTKTGRIISVSATSSTTSTTTTVRRNTTTTPVKKLPTTRMSAKSATAATKTTVKQSNTKSKVQNGECGIKKIKEDTVAISTTNEQDILRKDASPVEPTDNQLLITSD